MQVRLFEEKDYPEVCRWWNSRQWPAMTLRYLPKTGHIAYDGETLLAVAWLYFDTSCPFSWMDWLVTNPDIPSKQAVKAVHAVVDTLALAAKAHKAELMMTATNRNSLIRFLEKKDFKQSDKNVTLMFKALAGGK